MEIKMDFINYTIKPSSAFQLNDINGLLMRHGEKYRSIGLYICPESSENYEKRLLQA